MALHEAIHHIPGFEETISAVFVRRDFDTRMDASKPVFNATFYIPDIDKKDIPGPGAFSDPAITALYECAINSVSTKRAALDNALKAIRASRQLGEVESDAKLEYIHSWLELFSRVTYTGGIPSFFVQQFNCVETLPVLSHICAIKEKGDWKDAILHTCDISCKSVSVPEVWGEHPAITTGNTEADPAYEILRKWFEEGKVASNASSSVEFNVSSEESKTIHILCLPVFDFLHMEEQHVVPCGAFLGLLVFSIQSENPTKVFELACAEMTRLVPHLNTFAASLLESEFEQILREDYTGGDPFSFVAQTLRRIDGWELGKSTLGPDADRQHIEIDLRKNFFADPAGSDRAYVVALDDWTVLPAVVPKTFRIRLNRRLRDSIKTTNLHRQERLTAQSQGSLASKHDYSKDLNSNDIRMDRYERHVKQEREKLQTLIEKTSALETTDASSTAKAFVVEGLKEVHREYGVPLLDLMALTRYQMMRQKAKNAGSLYEEPQFCVERLIDGTKNDVVRVVNLLVWMRSPEWIDPARAPQENGRDFAAWGRIFAYETVASNHLSRIAEHLFHKLEFQLEELDHYFPRPLLRCLVPQDGGERESALTEPFLWPQHEGNPVRPHLFGFFPLFVEAMRSAYLHAYAATLDRVLALGRKQDVPQRAVGVQHPFQQFITLRPTWRLEADGRVRDYRLKISFSGPPSPAAPSSATLPLGDWHSETACFQKLVSQWKASAATEVIAGQKAPAFSITIASH